MADYGWVRASTGSQDVQTQERDILAVSPSAIIIRPDTKAASASKGEQLDALDTVIAMLRKGDRVIVTDSSRLDRRENLWDQLATIMKILDTGATVVSLDPDEDDFAVDPQETIARQKANAAKSRKVKSQTWRGVQSIIANKAFMGPLPVWWETKGARYSKQAHCTEPGKVEDVYRRIANGESMGSVARSHGVRHESIRTLICYQPNYTGIIQCIYTYNGEAHRWTHKVEPVVTSEQWHRANRAIDKNAAGHGGRTANPENWLNNVLDCPECGGPLYLTTGKTHAGNTRTLKLRCTGLQRKACGKYKPAPAEPVMTKLDAMFRETDTPILAYQRVSGNQHELDELQAGLDELQATLSTVTDRQARRDALAAIEAAEDEIEAFTVVPDTFDYAPTGETLAALWADEANRHSMLKAIKQTMGLDFYPPNDIYLGVIPSETVKDNICDLGNGICFRLVQA